MSLKQELIHYLRNHRLVNDQVAGRVYPGMAPTSAGRPYITIEQLGGSSEHHFDGVTDLLQARVRINSYADGAQGALDAANAVRLAMDGFRGALSAIDIRIVWLRDMSDDYFPPADGSQVGAFYEERNFDIWYRLTAPTRFDQPLRRT